MIVSCRVKYCELMPDSTPFVLFGLEVVTAYSSTILPKRYEHFYEFHKKLSYFWNVKHESSFLLSYLPSLPGYTNNLTLIRLEFSQYIEKIMQILQNSNFNIYHPWIKLINQFLKAKCIAKEEENKALVIQKVFKERFKQKVDKKNTILVLPFNVIQRILMFSSISELKPLRLVSKVFSQVSLQCELIDSIVFHKFQCKNITIIDFSYSDLINASILALIASNCNFAVLKALNFSHCPYIADSAILALASPFQDLNANISLESLNLSYCNISNQSIDYIKAFSQLKNLEIEACSINDHAVFLISKCFTRLQSLNLAKTEITNTALVFLSNTTIKTLNISGCPLVEFTKIDELKGKTVISTADFFYVSLFSKDMQSEFRIKAHKSMLVKDISTFLHMKLNTIDQIRIKNNEKVLNLHDSLIALPQVNCSVTMTFDVISSNWHGLPKWASKKSTRSCMRCQKAFKWYHSETNCHNCGFLCCSACIKSKEFIEKFGYTLHKVPVCVSCYKSVVISLSVT
jgi:hypothetical protein